MEHILRQPKSLLESIATLLEDSTPKLDTSGYSGKKGSYACSKPSTSSHRAFKEFLDETYVPFSTNEFDKEAHVTLIYSKSGIVDASKVDKGLFKAAIAIPLEFEYWEGHDKEGYVVLKVKCNDFNRIHKELIKAGGKHSFDDYTVPTPHMTIGKDVGKKTYKMDRWITIANKLLKENPMELKFDKFYLMDINND